MTHRDKLKHNTRIIKTHYNIIKRQATITYTKYEELNRLHISTGAQRPYVIFSKTIKSKKQVHDGVGAAS